MLLYPDIYIFTISIIKLIPYFCARNKKICRDVYFNVSNFCSWLYYDRLRTSVKS